MYINSIFTSYYINVNVNWINDGEWHYECIDMYSAFINSTGSYNYPKSTLTLYYVLFNKIYNKHQNLKYDN